ncbi:zinc finger protein 671-like [Wyeomyia smithii]|uniref:zinc finger protein 671-like n=1 Tax=Wyeomyia smithii TaxID=174621 RepID=UPI002467E02E|nr:zinc finger protein 671-like [Wyeomyia smithii]
MSQKAAQLSKPPKNNAKLYCRLCFSLSGLKPLTSSNGPVEACLIPIILKQLGIQLIAEDFPCAICAICEEKLEELKYSNDDGLLDEWGDEGLLEYRSTCSATNQVILKHKSTRRRAPKKRKPPVNNRVTLPFERLHDNRYKCILCLDLFFNHISDCIKHYHEMHPDANLAQNNAAANLAAQEARCLVCITCSAIFDHMDELLLHRQTHKPPEQNGFNTPGNYLFKCTICQAGFHDIDKLIEHRAEMHEPQLKRKKPKKNPIKKAVPTRTKTLDLYTEYNCSVCDLCFNNPKSYYFHLNVAHGGNICDICGEKFQSASALAKHQAWHRAADEQDYNTSSPLPGQQYSPLCAVADNIVEQNIAITRDEEPNFSCEMFVTCSGCLLAFRTDLDLNEHYKDCPAQLMMSDEPFVIEDDETKIVEISDDE